MYDILVQQFCVYWRGEHKVSGSDFVRKERKYVRLEQGPGTGQAHLALKFNLLAEVDQLFSALHALDIFIAILDELQRKTDDQ